MIKLLFAFLAVASCALIEQDPNIANLFDANVINSGTAYTSEFINKLANESGPSLPPIFDSFNDPTIKQQLRKNVILIIDKMLSMQQSNMTECALQRLSEAKAIRDIYSNDKTFNNRPLPRYYHATTQYSVPLILDSMQIKYSEAAFHGAWFGTGFYLEYSPVFAFGSELEQPLNEVSNQSHYVRLYGSSNYFGLDRLHNVSMWKNNTDLVSWGVRPDAVDNMTNYINSHYDEEKASFLLSRFVPLDQIVLERQLLTIAHAYTNDRVNALLDGSFSLSDLPKFNGTYANISIGQLAVYRGARLEMYFSMVVSFNASSQYTPVSFLSLHVTTRQTQLIKMYLSSYRFLICKYVPDIEINDMTVLAQLIADGKLLDQPPPTTVNLQRSVKKLMTRVKHVTSEEQHRDQLRFEKFHEDELRYLQDNQ
jgi:hypothetical protein